MHPELFTLPILDIDIKTYGFFLTVGFLSAVWLAMRRAARVQVDPDRVLDLSFLALIFGVGGARLFYVVHYWKTDFAPFPNVFFRIIDIRQGGLEFLGGLLGSMFAILVYLVLKKQSVRLYLDVLAPGAAWGLAFGRIGCFFNGCCFGGLCTTAEAHTARFPWAVEFPYGSPAQMRQWEDRKVTIPAELIVTDVVQSFPIPASTLRLPIEKREAPRQELDELKANLASLKEANAGAAQIRKVEEALQSREKAWETQKKQHGLHALAALQQFPSRRNPERKTSVSELEDLASQAGSLPVHPTQLYSAIHALILSGFLSAVFYQRKRHGVVIGLLIVLYPIGRILLELIRADNPHDTAGLTVSQFVSVSMFVVGVAYLIMIYRFLPERSPKAAAARMPEVAPDQGE